MFCGTGIHLARAIDPAFGKEASFVPVGDPAGHAADGKNDREIEAGMRARRITPE